MMSMPKRDLRLLMLLEFKLRHNAFEVSNNINRAISDRTNENLEDEEGRI